MHNDQLILENIYTEDVNQTEEVQESMKLKPVGSNQTEIHRSDGAIVLFSYETPVAVFIPDEGALCTTTKYSVTTSKHINLALKRWGASCRKVDQEIVDKYADMSR